MDGFELYFVSFCEHRATPFVVVVEALNGLRRPWFAGSSLLYVMPQDFRSSNQLSPADHSFSPDHFRCEGIQYVYFEERFKMSRTEPNDEERVLARALLGLNCVTVE